jgi:hypothetical protein
MNTTKIRDSIALAVDNEQQTRHLEKVLCLQIDKLHSAIKLPTDNTVEALLDFVIKYIQNVPDMLDAVHDVTNKSGIGQDVQPFLALAEEYFLKPPEIISGHTGLDELMDEAYLTHRLIEEINDRYVPRTGIPLIPIDMTCSNLIIHHLIGEPFANELDDAVHITAESLVTKETYLESSEFKTYIEERKKSGWTDFKEKWPCLTDDLAIDLTLRG